MNQMKASKNEEKVKQASNLIPNSQVGVENVEKASSKFIFLFHVKMKQKVNDVDKNDDENHC